MQIHRFHQFLLLTAIALVAACYPYEALAEIKLPAVVGDNMVLQHGRPVPIWGWADPNETVTVTAAGQTASAKADQDGRWQVRLPKLEVSAKPMQMQIRGSSGSALTVSDILVGEVWFCTGPSNIFWPVSRCDNAKREMATAKYPGIRFFTVQRKTADKPQADCVGNWFACSPDTVGGVSGIGYFFSRRLHKDLNMPIGLLQSYWGGSRVEAWTSMEALEAEPELKPILDWWAKSFAQFDSGQTKAAYDGQLKEWQQTVAKAKAEGTKPPRKPQAPENPHLSRHRPASLYNGMVAPLVPFAMRGVISYQGLGNLFWAQYTRELLVTQIRDWRSRWGQGSFPFGMVQPAPFPCDRWPKCSEDAYSLQREGQLLVLDTVPDTGVAPTMDIGDLKELHFTNKQDVARRLVAWALATVYGRDMPYSGPVYESMAVEGDAIRIRFRHTGTGLMTNDGRPPSSFATAGPDKVFHPATARIDGHTVIVRSDRVRTPVAVRFAFNDTEVPNLFNKEGLPASLFRTGVSRAGQTVP